VTLIEYRSGLIVLLSLDARPAFNGPYSAQTTVGVASHRGPGLACGRWLQELHLP
jgi:hypothetical protein